MVGLGNPGPRYAFTRHNVGFRVLDALGDRCGIRMQPERFEGPDVRGHYGAGTIASRSVGLLAPTTWMNRSGEVVAAALGAWPGFDCEQDLIVVYDDLDLPFGQLRLRPRGGAGGHRGVESLIECLGQPNFARLRFGIGRPEAGRDIVEYVLESFLPAQEAALGEQLARAADALEAFVADGIGPAMDRYNRAPSPASPPSPS